MTTLTALEGRSLVFSDGSRREPPTWMTIEHKEQDILLYYVSRDKHWGKAIKIGDTEKEVANILEWFDRHRAAHAPEVSA